MEIFRSCDESRCDGRVGAGGCPGGGMACLHGMRAVARFVVLLLLLLHCGAWAFTCTQYEWQMFDGTWTTSKSAAANSKMGKKGSYANCTGFSIYPHDVSGLGTPTDAAYSFHYSYCDDSLIFSSENQGTLPMRTSAGTCICTPPLIEVDGQCVSPCLSKTGTQIDVNFGLGGVSGAVPPGMGARMGCSPGSPAPAGYGCRATGTVTSAVWLTLGQAAQGGPNPSYGGLPGGQWGGWARMTYDGNTCTIDNSSDGTNTAGGIQPPTATGAKAASTTCKEGEFAGTVNGQSFCAPPSDKNSVAATTGSSSTSTSSNPDGSTTTTSISKSGSDVCINGICTTTTTTKTTSSVSGGTPTIATSTSTGTATIGDFCKSNATSQACKDDKGSFGGSCDSSFTCTGDAVTCAIATSVNKSRCGQEKFLLEDAALKQAGADAIAAGSNGSSTSTVTLTSADINKTNPWSSQCPADKVLNLSQGRQITFPLSQGCSALQAMGTVLVAVALLVAARIVGSA